MFLKIGISVYKYFHEHLFLVEFSFVSLLFYCISFFLLILFILIKIVNIEVLVPIYMHIYEEIS